MAWLAFQIDPVEVISNVTNSCEQANNSLITVSIVEASAKVRETISGWFEPDRGFRHVGSYDRGEAALQNLPYIKPKVIVIEINLPDMSGTECVRQLKPLLPGTQFVMLTYCEDINRALESLTAGANGYLLKPTSRRKLLAALKDVCNSGSPMTSRITRKIIQSFQTTIPVSSKTFVPRDFSPRQGQILEYVRLGYGQEQIARALDISINTVHTHLRRLYKKLNVQSATQAIIKSGLASPIRSAQVAPSHHNHLLVANNRL